MGIYDRDYARAGGGGGMPPRSGIGGALSGKSANTWLIIVNVAVFLLGSLLFGPKQIDIETQRFAVARQGVTQEQVADGVKDRSGLVVYSDGNKRYEGYAIKDAQGETIAYQEVLRRPVLDGLGHFSTGKGFLELEVWRLVTFQFLHAGMGHLLMNMIGLYFFGPVVEKRLGSKRIYLAFYLISGIFGALLYLVLNLLGNIGLSLPGLLFQDVYTPLVGASAGVFGVLLAAAYLAKDSVILLMFVLPMKIRNAVVLLIGIEMWHLLMNASNAGGNAAHLGGAAAGWFFIRRTHLLTDFFDVFGPSKGKAERGRGTFPRGTGPKPPRKKISARVGRTPSQKEIDAVLDKVRREGMHSLSEKEKGILRKATDEQRGG